MTKKLVIERLKATQNMLAELKEEQFDFNDFVSVGKGKCGTVCCAAGWYPKYFPEAGLTWNKMYENEIVLMFGGSDDNDVINQAISIWHGLKINVVKNIFYNGDNYSVDSVSKETVIKRIQSYIDKIEASKKGILLTTVTD